MKTYIWIVVIVALAILSYFLWFRPVPTTTPYTPPQTTETKGTVVVSFTDQTASIKNVNEVHMEVSKVQLYSQTHGWVDVGSNDVDYKLLALKASGQSQVYTAVIVPTDTYTQTKVTIKKVAVDTKTKGQKTAVVPNNEITFSGKVVVEDQKTSSIHIDVLADQSLHLASNGIDYVFTPVVTVEDRSNITVNSAADGTVSMSGGTVDANVSSGMDLDGSMKADFKLDAKSVIKVSGGVIQVPANTATTTGTMKVKDSSTGGTVNGTVNGVINY